MLHRLILRAALVLMAGLMWVTPVMAGGWAVVTLDQLPAQIVAGRPIDVGFTVRQHGRTLRSDLTPIVLADRIDAKDSFRVTAERKGVEGHYVATLAFPSAGEWNWRVDVEEFGMMTQPLPKLTVLDAANARALTFASQSGAGDRATLMPGILATLIRLLETALIKSSNAAPSQVQLGQDLFLAKGCAMCHRHDAVRDAWQGFGSVEIGPNLTTRKLDPDYLRRWLKDPSAIKPGTVMPTLGLSDGEIEALVAFLNSK